MALARAFRCSVEQNTGTIGECVWVFAASNEEMESSTGEVMVQTETWRCPITLPAETSAQSFLEELSLPGQQPLYASIPGAERTLYDGLIDCL
jgi:hypothetical protein